MFINYKQQWLNLSAGDVQKVSWNNRYRWSLCGKT